MVPRAQLWPVGLMALFMTVGCAAPTQTEIATRVAATLTAIVPSTVPVLGETPIPVGNLAPTTCADEGAAYLIEMQPLLNRWDDAARLADSTTRVALGQPIADLQEVRRELAALAVVPCMKNLKVLYLRAMDEQIAAYLLFMRQGSGGAIATHLTTSGILFDRARQDLAALQDGWPQSWNASRLCTYSKQSKDMLDSVRTASVKSKSSQESDVEQAKKDLAELEAQYQAWIMPAGAERLDEALSQVFAKSEPWRQEALAVADNEIRALRVLHECR